LAFKQRSAGAEWLRGKPARMNLDPINVHLDNDHIGIRETGRKLRIPFARPHGSHLGNIVDDRGSPA
jgi:hypothetical protein